MVAPVNSARESEIPMSTGQMPSAPRTFGDSINPSQESWAAFFLSKLQSAWNYLLHLFYCCFPRAESSNSVHTEAPPYRQERPVSAEPPEQNVIVQPTEEAPVSEPRELPSSPPPSTQPRQPTPPPTYARDTLRKVQDQAVAAQYTDEAPPNNHLKMEQIFMRAFLGCGDTSPQVAVLQLKFPLIDMSQNHKLVFEVDKEKQQFSIKSEGDPYDPIAKNEIKPKFIQRWNIAYSREGNCNKLLFTKKASSM